MQPGRQGPHPRWRAFSSRLLSSFCKLLCLAGFAAVARPQPQPRNCPELSVTPSHLPASPASPSAQHVDRQQGCPPRRRQARHHPA